MRTSIPLSCEWRILRLQARRRQENRRLALAILLALASGAGLAYGLGSVLGG